VGFIVTLVLALLFLSLGALVMYGRGQAFPNSAAAFAGQLISLYTKNLGPWAFPFIAIACFTTMFSTTLTVLDAYPRMLRKMTIQLIPHRFSDEECKKVYSFWVIVTAIGTVIIIYGFLSNMKAMVDFATVLSFVVAPVIAVLNYLVIQDKDLPAQAHFGPKMKAFCWVGFAALFGFTALYLLRFF
jgi:Mn2+/Fe2+ NRAMP family transporter